MITNDLHSALSLFLAQYEQVCIVADDKLTLPAWEYPIFRLHVSEELKNLDFIGQIWDFFFANELTRKGLVIAIGGGVLTDMAGFAASTYKRGVDYINIPTTLLAMVDASTGGKTGINYHGIKNSIGAFHKPVETLICPQWLHTLPPQQLLSGFGEMLKTGLIENTDRLWDALLQYDLDRMDIEALTPLIYSCVRAKEAIVAADPQEEGLRKVLNFGHTFGHALEEVSLTSGAGLLHGYAVVYGLIAELYLSVTKLGCPREPLQQLTQVMLHYYGKPQCKCSDREQLVALMRQDKKNERAAEINCTLINQIGSPLINQVISTDEANEALDYLFSL